VVGISLSAVDTPALIIDLDALEANTACMRAKVAGSQACHRHRTAPPALARRDAAAAIAAATHPRRSTDDAFYRSSPPDRYLESDPIRVGEGLDSLRSRCPLEARGERASRGSPIAA
jgi:hypothetical protein